MASHSLSSSPNDGVRWGSVERRSVLDRATFRRDFERRNIPVCLTGATIWRGEEPFAPPLLRRLYGATRLADLQSGFGGDIGLEKEHLARMVTLADYLDQLESPGTECAPSPRSPMYEPYASLRSKETATGLPYLTNMSLPDNFPLVAERFQIPHCFGPNLLHTFPRAGSLVQGELFIAPRDTSYGELHFDRFHLFVVSHQLWGRKQWFLIPPSESKHCYPMGYPNDWYPHFSPVDPENPDLTRYPDFAKTRGLSVVLEPGDVLFCPASWWHHTKNLDANASVAVRLLTTTNLAKAVRDVVAATFIDAQVNAYRRVVLRRK